MTERPTAPIALPAPPAPVHFVGIGGAGMQGLAHILTGRGYAVSGSDRADSPALEELRAAGATIFIGHDAVQVGNAALVVITAAVNDANPEVAAARARGIPVIKRAVLLGMLANAKRLIAVAGTHGKSTTSGMIAHILTELGLDPFFVIGATVRDLGTSARDGNGEWAVVEADEYDYSFLQLRPEIAVITNIEHDHPDLFPDEDAYMDAFRLFVKGIRPRGTLVLSGGDLLLPSLLAYSERVQLMQVGADNGTWRVDIAATPPILSRDATIVGEMSLAVPGVHNLLNAAMAVAVCEYVGVDAADALRVVSAYRGVGRRFEVVGERGGVVVVDDYAHHPTEIRATLEAARSRYPGRRIIAVFQPHTYSRTAMLHREMGASLGGADMAFVTNIYAAREPDPGTVTAADVAAHIPDGNGTTSGTLDATVTRVCATVQPGDVVLTLGAGDITTVGPCIVASLPEGEQWR